MVTRRSATVAPRPFAGFVSVAAHDAVIDTREGRMATKKKKSKRAKPTAKHKAGRPKKNTAQTSKPRAAAQSGVGTSQQRFALEARCHPGDVASGQGHDDCCHHAGSISARSITAASGSTASTRLLSTSRPCTALRGRKHKAGSVTRVAASEIEGIVSEAVRKHFSLTEAPGDAVVPQQPVAQLRPRRRVIRACERAVGCFLPTW